MTTILVDGATGIGCVAHAENNDISLVTLHVFQIFYEQANKLIVLLSFFLQLQLVAKVAVIVCQAL